MKINVKHSPLMVALVLLFLSVACYPQSSSAQKEGTIAVVTQEKEETEKPKEQENLQETREGTPVTTEKQENSQQTEGKLLQTSLENKMKVSGDLSLRYRLQATDGETDQDFYADLRLEVEDIVPNKVSFSFFGRGLFDVEGPQQKNANRSDYFRDIYDTYDNAVQGRLYHAYLTLDDFLLPNSLFRIGRQTIYLDQSYDFDGAFGEVRLHKMVKISAFGGSSVFHFKGPRGGDWLVGGGAEFSPLPKTKLQIDSVYLEEHADGIKRDDYQIIFRLRQKIWKQNYFFGELTVLNDDVKDVSFTLSSYFPEYGLQVRIRFYALVNQLENINSSISRFFGSYSPYRQVELNLSKTLGKYFLVSAGYSARILDHDRDEGTYNREFHRYSATVSSEDWPFKGLEASVSLQGWAASGFSDNNKFGIDADLGYRFNEKLKGSIGTYYELFDYELNFQQQLQERIGLTGIYVKADYQANQIWSSFGKFEWEYDEERDFYLLELGIKAKF